MTHHLPSLSMLRAFETTARLGSFTQAAEELNMTQGAVSYQVRRLEEHLGQGLFLRTPRKLVLTADGGRLAHALIDAFGALETALDELSPRSAGDDLSLAVVTSFAAKWLVPRLPGFQRAFPQINLRVLGEDRPAEASPLDHDLGIRYGSGKWPGLEAGLLHRDAVFPVCSPGLLGERQISNLQDLAAAPLLNGEGRNLFEDGSDWDAWFHRLAPDLLVEGIDQGRRSPVRYSQAALALQAAIAGQGVTLSSGFLIIDDLVSGRLVCPLRVSVPADFAYYLLEWPTRPLTRCARNFRDWLMMEIAATRRQLDQATGGVGADDFAESTARYLPA